ncbi:MAG: hypothetical protein M1814_004289 [Vezdaea aestivalis]|nr:MAG: hypothetical protein M1814_004289 [Vezdaea aestivalis]
MASSVGTLPIVDLSLLHSVSDANDPRLGPLVAQLDDVFSSTGFAYLVNAPLSFKHGDVFDLARKFFELGAQEKWKLAKRQFLTTNQNTYRGWFPPQAGSDNLKEGLDIGPPAGSISTPIVSPPKINLNEVTPLPDISGFPSKVHTLYDEMQQLSERLLDLLARALGSQGHFSSYMQDSLSTLRLLHYPPSQEKQQELICTPHTDSGLLTLLRQDNTGGLEVFTQEQEWVQAPYVPGSIVVNIGDLMARISGGRWVATMHRVRRVEKQTHLRSGLGRFSVPFFFEPGENCLVETIGRRGLGEGILYGDHVRQKMSTWIEFQDVVASDIPRSVSQVEVF